MSSPEAAMLFAAGFGTRMAPLTATCPKPLIKVAGKPLFDHALHLIRDAGINGVVANTHYLASMMSDHLRRVGVTESHELQILDTGGGLKYAVSMLGGPSVYTLNTDAVWTGKNPVCALRDAWDPQHMDALLMLVPLAAAVGHGGKGDFVIGHGGRLTRGLEHVYTGLQIIKTAPFLAEAETVFGMFTVWDPLLASGRIFGIVHGGGWCDVGRPDCIPLAEAMLGHTHV